MPLAPEEPDTRLRRRQTDQIRRHKGTAQLALLGGPALDIPARGRVDGQDGDLGLLEGVDDGVKGLADGRLEGEAEDGVDDEVCLVEGGVEGC